MLNSGPMSPSASFASDKVVNEKGLPANIDAEKFILGSLLLDDARFLEIAGIVEDVMNRLGVRAAATLDAVLAIDAEARRSAERFAALCAA